MKDAGRWSGGETVVGVVVDWTALFSIGAHWSQRQTDGRFEIRGLGLLILDGFLDEI